MALFRDPNKADPKPAPAESPAGVFSRLRRGLAKTRQNLGGVLDRLAGGKIAPQVLDELEEALVTADLGVATTTHLIDGLRERLDRQELKDGGALRASLAAAVAEILAAVPAEVSRNHHPHVIMVVGVNGVGKTTTIGKLAHYFQGQGRSPLLAAADTFRAAAVEQLAVWAQRAGCDLVSGQPGADPSAVAYDALAAAQSRGRDMVIIDTAGRLHTNRNLVEELKKIHRVLGRQLAGAPHEVLLVLDATTGQNALSQARLFGQAVPLSAVALAKLDGSAKGGVVVAIAQELGLPVLFVGLGEGIEDLRPLDAQEFARALF